MLEKPLAHPGQLGRVVIDVLGAPSSALLEQPLTSHRDVASMTLRVSWVPSWTYSWVVAMLS